MFSILFSAAITTFAQQLKKTVVDIDGNVYHTVKIGKQVWMIENLKTTRYRNGDTIPNVTDIELWANLTTGAYCSYNNNDSNAAIYGHLYNWFAVNDQRDIAPKGWHIPTKKEWLTLVMYLGGDSIAGGKLKEKDTVFWYSPNAGATNEFGFTALPGGYRFHIGGFEGMGFYGVFWSATESTATNAWSINFYTMYGFVDYDGTTNKNYGLSVRCIKD